MDAGVAYGRKPPTHNAALTEVGPGTPAGEFLRRYWHPVGLAADASDRPRRLRVLGEELILFRDLSGRPGLLYPRCMHRGTTLYYGRVEPAGIRCCYHGWLFDVEGRCLDQPCEPDGGRQKDQIRQPWYPVEERYGLIFAYLGPPERRPVLPRYQLLETLEPDESIEADDTSIGSGGPAIVPCNWLQHFENVLDTFHVAVLHGTFSGTQFVPEMAIMPTVTWSRTDLGVAAISHRSLDDGRVLRRVTEVALPTLRLVPSPRLGRGGRAESIGWTLPIDDTHYRIYTAGRVRAPGELGRVRSTFGGRTWSELTEAEHQRFPGDYEAQTGQGPISLHSEEHLATSDRGIAMLRRLLSSQIRAVAQGKDPIGVGFDPAAPPIVVEAGNYLEGEAQPA